MAANAYDVGQIVRFKGTFTDPNNNDAPIDPTDVYIAYLDPSENLTTLHYDVDVDLKKESTGIYYVDVEMDEAGRWYYRVYSTGVGQAAGEAFVDVKTLDTAT